MERLVFFVGVIGNIISVLMFLSPGKTFLRIVKNKSTEEFESLPYICTLLNSSLWTYYGVIKPGSYLVATVNGFGVVVEIIYVALFLLFAPPSKRAKTAIMFGILNVGFLAAAISVTYLLLDGDVRIDAIGLISSGLNIIMYGSPLSAMKTVVATKSAEYMPFLLSFFLFLNGGVWTFYAVLVQDWFLGAGNTNQIMKGQSNRATSSNKYGKSSSPTSINRGPLHHFKSSNHKPRSGEGVQGVVDKFSQQGNQIQGGV